MEAKITEKLMSVEEVGEVLGVGRTTLNMLLWRGELASIKIGRRRMIRPADLERFLSDHEDKPGD